MTIDLSRLDALKCHADGGVTLGGPLLAHFQHLDGFFASWVNDEGGESYRFPDQVPVAMMQRIGYLASFPHLATFVTALPNDGVGLKAFSAQMRLGGQVEVDPALLSSPMRMLAPAACFHAYAQQQDVDLAAPHVATMMGSCCRNEDEYRPLRRQRVFSMRELVCIGTAQEVESFVERMKQRICSLLAALEWPVEWAQATDPFFDPQHDPKHLAQRLAPLKTEARYNGDLALCSLNLHGTFFGDAFSIQREGATAYSACVAFGLERWLYAFADRFGSDVGRWPRLEPGT